jgi:hypothetical protein
MMLMVLTPEIRELLQKALDFGYDRGMNEAWNANFAYKESQYGPTVHSVDDFIATLSEPCGIRCVGAVCIIQGPHKVHSAIMPYRDEKSQHKGFVKLEWPVDIKGD